MIRLNQNAWLKRYTYVNTDLRKKNQKMIFRLINNAVFGEAMENFRKHRDSKFVTTEPRRKYFVSKRSYHAMNFFL